MVQGDVIKNDWWGGEPVASLNCKSRKASLRR